MRFQFLVLAALVALTGCDRQDSTKMGMTEVAAGENMTRHAQNYMPAAKDEPAASHAPGATLAYEHSISLDISEDRIAAVFEAEQAVCREAAADQCTLLESRLDVGRDAYASLKFRAQPAGIKKLLAALTAQGGVVDQTTTVEDLAGPLQDTARKLAMLRDYRAKLEALRGRASSNIDTLIKVNKELAQVQSDLEALAGQQAHLVQRVETEILNVRLSSSHNRGFFSPIWRALSRFGANLSDGLAGAITGIAYILPWLPILFLFVWGSRKLWGRMKRGKAGA
jgi:hypothetical protein